MADFSALKTSIQNYIKQNGNEEITGNLLQQILLSMVSTLGDSAINDLVTALNAEIANRGNADTELEGRITTLQGVVNGIVANVENGYVYAGIATPSATPVSGKVFYLALTAGTYTNFGSIVVPQGINILKYNGSAWSLDSFLGLDDAPTQGSNNLVKSGGVLDSIIKDGSAFDLSAYNNGNTYADLSAALTALNVLPAAYKKGGMSMKFVQSSDNKYVQFRFMLSGSFTAQQFTNTANWQGVEGSPVYNSINLVNSGGIFKTFKDYGNSLLYISVISGYNIGADGSLTSGGTQNPYIYNVEGVKFVILRYTIYSGVAVAPYAIYNSLKEFSSTTALVVAATSAKTSPTTYEVMINIPDGAKALLVTSRDTYTPEVYSSNLVMADFIKDATLELDKDSTINSKAIGTDGNLVENSAHQVWTFDVSNTYATLFDFFFKSGGELCEYAFYNSESVFDSSTCILLGIKNLNTSGITKSYFTKVPVGAKRLLINYRVGEGSVHCYTTKINKVIDSIKNDINENRDKFNQFVNKNKIIESLSFAERSPLALTSIDYVGVNDFHRVRFEGNVGEVYTTTSENVGNQWYTSKLPVQKGFDAIIVGRRSSVFDANILVLDANNVILFKKTLTSNDAGVPIYVKVSEYANAAYISFMYPTDNIQPVYFLPSLSQRHELNFEVRANDEIIAYKYDGSIDTGTPQPFNNYRIDVTRLSNFIAYVYQYSGVGTMSISYFDKNDNYISSEYRQTSTAEWNYLLCTVPQNASYAQILSRELYEEEVVGNFRAKVYALSPFDANKYNGIVTENIATKNVEQHYYSGEVVSLNTFIINTIGKGIITAAANNPIHPQDTTNGQGCCIYKDYLFRLHNYGYCNIYNIKYLDNITKVNGFELGSYGSNNHANCASFSPQIDETTGFPYLYVGFNYNELIGEFYVERISLQGSTLIQTISINIGHTLYGNLLIGDDGYLYYYGNPDNSTTTIEFYKFNCPAVDAGDVTLTAADVLDSWTWTDSANDKVVQGGFFRNGKLYVCNGQSDGAVRDVDRNIDIFDWAKKERVSYVPLKPYESHEPEDIYPYKGKIFMVVNGANEAYIIDFI